MHSRFTVSLITAQTCSSSRSGACESYCVISTASHLPPSHSLSPLQPLILAPSATATPTAKCSIRARTATSSSRISLDAANAPAPPRWWADSVWRLLPMSSSSSWQRRHPRRQQRQPPRLSPPPDAPHQPQQAQQRLQQHLLQQQRQQQCAPPLPRLCWRMSCPPAWRSRHWKRTMATQSS